MSDEEVTYIPKGVGGYICRLEFVKSGNEYAANLVDTVVEDFLFLLGSDAENPRLPIIVDGTWISTVPNTQNQIQFGRQGRVLTFDEAIRFMDEQHWFKRI